MSFDSNHNIYSVLHQRYLLASPGAQYGQNHQPGTINVT